MVLWFMLKKLKKIYQLLQCQGMLNTNLTSEFKIQVTIPAAIFAKIKTWKTVQNISELKLKSEIKSSTKNIYTCIIKNQRIVYNSFKIELDPSGHPEKNLKLQNKLSMHSANHCIIWIY